MPSPSSETRTSVVPPSSTSTTTRVAPASSAFSTSSFTTLDGRSTTSPAAIWFASSSVSLWMRPTRGPALPLGDRIARRFEELARSLPREGEDDERAREGPHDEPSRHADGAHGMHHRHHLLVLIRL